MAASKVRMRGVSGHDRGIASRRSAVGVTVLAALAWSGCNAIMGYEVGESGGTGQGGSAIGGASAGGGGSTAGSETCLDRVDNNGDGLADCEDPLCQSDHECVPTTTDDWLGVGWLYQDDPAASCPLGQRLELFDESDLVVPSAACTCACDDPTSNTCRAQFACGYSCGVGGVYSASASAQCIDHSLSSVSQVHCTASVLSVVPGTCSPRGDPTGPAVHWPSSASICLYASGGHCPDGGACIPEPTASALAPCIAQMGEHPCPASHPEQHLYWDGTADDGRSCSADGCSCGQATGASCGCTDAPCGVELFGGAGCLASSPGVAPPDDSSCLSIGPFSGGGPFFISHQLVGAGITDPGSCGPSGSSQPQGEVTPGARITICCTEPSL